MLTVWAPPARAGHAPPAQAAGCPPVLAVDSPPAPGVGSLPVLGVDVPPAPVAACLPVRAEVFRPVLEAASRPDPVAVCLPVPAAAFPPVLAAAALAVPVATVTDGTVRIPTVSSPGYPQPRLAGNPVQSLKLLSITLVNELEKKRVTRSAATTASTASGLTRVISLAKRVEHFAIVDAKRPASEPGCP